VLFRSLKDIGFNDKEILIYSTLLPLGSASIRILAEKTGINRGTVYDVLESLSQRGFIEIEKRGSRRKFLVKSPEELLNSLEKQQRDLEIHKKKVEDVMPQLLSFYAKQGGRPSVEYFDDDEGIKQILEDVLKTVSQKNDSKEYYVYSSRPVRQYLYRLFPNFTKERIKKHIKIKVIALGEGGDQGLQLAQRKWIPKDAPAYILIYGSKVALISVADDNVPFGVIINDSKIAETQRIIFEELFLRLK